MWDTILCSGPACNIAILVNAIYNIVDQIFTDYLDQKKINNFDMVDKPIVKGKHEPIITEEIYFKIQNILNEIQY